MGRTVANSEARRGVRRGRRRRVDLDVRAISACNGGMRRAIAIAVLMFGLAAPAWAGFDEGLEAYERLDYETALREWRPLAEQGICDWSCV